MIDRFEAKGLILSGRSTTDHCRVCGHLTAAAEVVVPRMRGQSAAVIDRLRRNPPRTSGDHTAYFGGSS